MRFEDFVDLRDIIAKQGLLFGWVLVQNDVTKFGIGKPFPNLIVLNGR